MDTKLYVGNMSRNTTEEDIRTMFSEAGTVGAIEMIKDRQTGELKGFGFVTMSSQEEADKAIVMFNAKNLNASPLKVNIAKPREERSPVGSRPRTH